MVRVFCREVLIKRVCRSQPFFFFSFQPELIPGRIFSSVKIKDSAEVLFSKRTGERKYKKIIQQQTTILYIKLEEEPSVLLNKLLIACPVPFFVCNKKNAQLKPISPIKIGRIVDCRTNSFPINFARSKETLFVNLANGKV